MSKKLEVEVEGDARLAINLDPNNNGVGGSDFAFMLDLNNAQPSIKYGEKVHGPNRDQVSRACLLGISYAARTSCCTASVCWWLPSQSSQSCPPCIHLTPTPTLLYPSAPRSPSLRLLAA